MTKNENGIHLILSFMNDNLVRWLSEQLKARGWSMRELGRQADISHSWIADVLSGTKEANWEFCAAIAAPLGHTVTEVLLIAGKLTVSDVKGALPALPEDRLGTSRKILAVAETLTDDDQRVLLRVAEGLGGVQRRLTNQEIVEQFLREAEELEPEALERARQRLETLQAQETVANERSAADAEHQARAVS